MTWKAGESKILNTTTGEVRFMKDVPEDEMKEIQKQWLDKILKAINYEIVEED